MINGTLKQFLDTGWWNADATIYYKGFIHFLDSYIDNNGIMHLRIMRWRAKNINNKHYVSLLSPNNDLADFSEIELEDKNEDDLRERFLKAKIWDGKSFWEVEKELAWLDYSGQTEKYSDKLTLSNK